MKLGTFTYTKNKWSVESFPDLDSENTLILVFAAPEILEDPTPIKELQQSYPLSKIIGCSGSGEIADSHLNDKSLSVAVVRFEKSHIQIAKTEITNVNDSFSAGEDIIKQLNRSDLKGILVLSEGLYVNGTDLVNGINSISSNDLLITGGLAGDGSRFHETWTIYDGEIHKRSITAVGFYGEDIEIGYSSRGGWDIFGVERYITSAKGNILYELDGTPALTLYKEYLGELAKGLPATGLLYPMAIRKSKSDDNQLVRTILSVNEEDQSMTFAGDMPTGYRAQLMRANFDRLIGSAGEAADVITSKMEGSMEKPILSIAISCVGRRLLLGERTEEEIEAVLKGLPKGTQMVGFYSYGELSPITPGTCDLHNQTMTITTLSEK